MPTYPNTLPPIDFETPPLAPVGGGLLSVATVFDVSGPARHLGGVSLRSRNCDTGAATYSTALCDDDEPEIKLPGDRSAPVEFAPVLVYSASECRPDEPSSETLERARHTRTLREGALLEAEFAAVLLDAAGTPEAVPDLVSAVGYLEAAGAEIGADGMVIHAGRQWAAPAHRDNLVSRSGVMLRAPMGERWAFAPGYGDLGNVLVLTGPVFIWKHLPFEQSAVTGSHPEAEYGNTSYALSERLWVAAFECPLLAVQIDPTP